MSEARNDSAGVDPAAPQVDADKEITDGTQPVISVAQAEERADALGRTLPEAANEALEGDQPVKPRGHAPVPDNVSGGPTHAPVGSPNRALRPDLQVLGDGSARGETQPGIVPPGEAERAVGEERLKELREETKEVQEPVALRNGFIHVGSPPRAVLPVASTSFSFDTKSEGRGKNKKDVVVATLTPAQGEPVTVEGAGAEKVRQLLTTKI